MAFKMKGFSAFDRKSKGRDLRGRWRLEANPSHGGLFGGLRRRKLRSRRGIDWDYTLDRIKDFFSGKGKGGSSSGTGISSGKWKKRIPTTIAQYRKGQEIFKKK